MYSKPLKHELASCKLSKTQTRIPSVSGMSEITAFPPSPIVDDPSGLPSPTSSLTSSNCCLFTRCQPLYVSCCSVPLYFSRYCTVRLKYFIYFLCLLFMYYLCAKYYKLSIVQYCIANCVLWVPRLAFLDLRTHSWNWTCSSVGDLLYFHILLITS